MKFRKSLAGILSSALLAFCPVALGERDAFGREVLENDIVAPEAPARYPDYKWTDFACVKTTCDLASLDGKRVLKDSLEVVLEQEPAGVRILLIPKVGEQNKPIALNSENTSIDFLHSDLRVGVGMVEEYNFGAADVSTSRGYEKRKVGINGAYSVYSVDAFKQRLFSDILPNIDCGQNESYCVFKIKPEVFPLIKADNSNLQRNIDYSEYLIKQAGSKSIAELSQLRERAAGARQELDDAIRRQKNIANGDRNYHFVLEIDPNSAIREPVVGVLANASFLLSGLEYRSPEIFLKMQLSKDMLAEEYSNSGEVFVVHPSSRRLKFAGPEFINYGAKKYPHLKNHARASSLGDNWTYYYNAGYSSSKEGTKDYLSLDEGTCHSPELEQVIMKKNMLIFREFLSGKRALYVQDGVVIDSNWSAIRPREGVFQIPAQYIESVVDGSVTFKEISPLKTKSKSAVGAVRSKVLNLQNGIPEFWLASDVKYESAQETTKVDEGGIGAFNGSNLSGYRVHPADFVLFVDREYYDAIKKDGFAISNERKPTIRQLGFSPEMIGYENNDRLSFRKTNIDGIYAMPFKDGGSFFPLDLISSKSPNGRLLDGKREDISYWVWGGNLMPSAFIENIIN